MNSEMKSKIYTKTGDKGETSLFGGNRVPKNHPRLEAYGTVDELNVFVGSIRDFPIDNSLKEQIIIIQNKLMTISSILATEKADLLKKLPGVNEDDIKQLENYIDAFDKELPELKQFVIPGGNQAVSAAHKARVICRRAERLVIKLTSEFSVDEMVIKYLNRLSDYLFTLSRKIAKDLNVEETKWQTRK